MNHSRSENIFRHFLEGDIAPFYEDMYRDMLLYAAGYLPGHLSVLAEDCVQSAVEKTYYNRERFETPEQWKAFMLTCIRNQTISIFRSDNAAVNYQEYVKNTSELHEDILLDYIRQETLSALYSAIDSLPEDMRQLLELSFEKGMKNAEIAEFLGIAEITVKKRKARLIRMLRQFMPDGTWLLFLLIVCEEMKNSGQMILK